MDALPCETIYQILDLLLLTDLISLGKVDKFMSEQVSQYFHENPLVNNLKKIAKRFAQIKTDLFKYTITASEFFFSNDGKRGTLFKTTDSGSVAAELEIYNQLVCSRTNKNFDCCDYSWGSKCDVYGTMKRLKSWIYKEYSSSRLEVIIKDIELAAQKDFDIKNKDLRKLYAEKIGCNTPYKVTKAIAEAKAEYITSETESIYDRFKVKVDDEQELDRVWNYAKLCLRPFIRDIFKETLVIAERFHSTTIRDMISCWIKQFPELKQQYEECCNE
jgi:hypothetical protein